MKKYLTPFLISILVSACSDENSIKDAITNTLIDPDSVQFKEISISSQNKSSCVIWNAKNAMGGYSDWNRTIFMKYSGKWVITDKVAACSKAGLDRLDKTEDFRNESNAIAFDIKEKLIKLSGDKELSEDCQSKINYFKQTYMYTKMSKMNLADDLYNTYKPLSEKLRSDLGAGNCTSVTEG